MPQPTAPDDPHEAALAVLLDVLASDPGDDDHPSAAARAQAEKVPDALRELLEEGDDDSADARAYAERRRDRAGREYCVEPGRGRVPCPPKEGEGGAKTGGRGGGSAALPAPDTLAAKEALAAVSPGMYAQAGDAERMLRKLPLDSLHGLAAEAGLDVTVLDDGGRNTLAEALVGNRLGGKLDPWRRRDEYRPDPTHPIARALAADADSRAVVEAMVGQGGLALAYTRFRREHDRLGEFLLATKWGATGKAARAQIVARMQTAWKAADEVRERAKQANTAARAAVQEKLKPAAPPVVRLKQSPGLDRQTSEGAAAGLDFVHAVAHAPGVDVDLDLGKSSDGRAYYQHRKDGGQEIMLGNRFFADQHAKTMVHELGHMLEDNLGLAEYARAFLDYRCGEEEQAAQIYAGSLEFGRKDNFGRYFGGASAAYVGKSYRSGDTEVISMGLEALYHDPAGFCAADPEYATFIIHVLRGANGAGKSGA